MMEGYEKEPLNEEQRRELALPYFRKARLMVDRANGIVAREVWSVSTKEIAALATLAEANLAFGHLLAAGAFDLEELK